MSSFIRRAGPATLVMILAGSCGGPRVLPPDVKVNPSPKERYEIRLTLEEPPAYSRIEGNADFAIEDKSCMPMQDRIAGTKPRSWFIQPFIFERKDSNTYIGYVYSDWILDEDYYDMGDCLWKMTSVQALISIESEKQSAHIFGEDVVGGRSTVNLCHRPIKGYAWDFCSTPIDDRKIDEKDAQTYKVTLNSRKSPQ